MKDAVWALKIVGRQLLDLVDDRRVLTDRRSCGAAPARHGQCWSADCGIEPIVVVGGDKGSTEFRQSFVKPSALRVGVAAVRIENAVELDREIVFALQATR